MPSADLFLSKVILTIYGGDTREWWCLAKSSTKPGMPHPAPYSRSIKRTELATAIGLVGLLLVRAAKAGHAQRTHHRHALVAFVTGQDAGAIVARAGDVGVAVRLNGYLAGDGHVRLEAIP